MTSLSQAGSGPPRVVELFGPSSGGKSSLATRLVSGACAGRYVLHTDRVLDHLGLGWLPGWVLRTLTVDLVAALAVVASWRGQRECYRRAARQALRGAGPRGPMLRLMLLRNAWKGVALRLVAARLARPGEVVLLDEGPLQTANYLFVHTEATPDWEALDGYLAVLPLADAVLYVRADEAELVERTLARKHARVPSGSREATHRFVRHALAVFDRMAADPRVASRRIVREALLGPREVCA